MSTIEDVLSVRETLVNEKPVYQGALLPSVIMVMHQVVVYQDLLISYTSYRDWKASIGTTLIPFLRWEDTVLMLLGHPYRLVGMPSGGSQNMAWVAERARAILAWADLGPWKLPGGAHLGLLHKVPLEQFLKKYDTNKRYAEHDTRHALIQALIVHALAAQIIYEQPEDWP